MVTAVTRVHGDQEEENWKQNAKEHHGVGWEWRAEDE